MIRSLNRIAGNSLVCCTRPEILHYSVPGGVSACYGWPYMDGYVIRTNRKGDYACRYFMIDKNEIEKLGDPKFKDAAMELENPTIK